MPIKAGHGPSHSTDFNWPRLLPPTWPSQSGVSYIERQSVSPGSHYRESSALPTELQDGDGHPSVMVWLMVLIRNTTNIPTLSRTPISKRPLDELNHTILRLIHSAGTADHTPGRNAAFRRSPSSPTLQMTFHRTHQLTPPDQVQRPVEITPGAYTHGQRNNDE